MYGGFFVMKRNPVKIVATTGPATDNYKTILALAEAGVNVFRINLSHATQEEIDNRFSWIRKAEEELKTPLAIMGDLAGPKIRIEEIAEGTVLKADDTVTIYKEHIAGNSEKFSLNYPSIIEKIEPGAVIYVDDGAIKMQAVRHVKDGLEAV